MDGPAWYSVVQNCRWTLKQGYSTISFDAPAHGKSPGKTTIMVDFITTILELKSNLDLSMLPLDIHWVECQYWITIKKRFKVNHAVVIGSGDIVEDIIDDFIAKLN
jgi:hypothetical protein